MTRFRAAGLLLLAVTAAGCGVARGPVAATLAAPRSLVLPAVSRSAYAVVPRPATGPPAPPGLPAALASTQPAVVPVPATRATTAPAKHTSRAGIPVPVEIRNVFCVPLRCPRP